MRMLPTFKLTPIQQRRLATFKHNRRAYWSLWIFMVLFVISLGAELVANDKPLVMEYKHHLYFPVFKMYPETDFGVFCPPRRIFAILKLPVKSMPMVG